MEIQLHEIPISELVSGYKDNGENGVFGYNGQLEIRPYFQREFVYNEKQRNAVINSVRHNFPLNSMYWTENKDGTYGLLDGQQRTVSICQYVNGDFAVDYKYFHNLTDEEKQQILDYKLQVYFCNGTDSERLQWFEVINTAGVVLTKQELRNAVYAGTFTTNAKAYFSKTSCPAYAIGGKYLKGVAIRQDYLETVLQWYADKQGIDKVESVMAEHQNDENAEWLWNYFEKVMNWVKAVFPKYRAQMKGVEWGLLYNRYGSNFYDPTEMEEKVSKLMKDQEVQKKAGIYTYVFDGDERALNLRQFGSSDKETAYERQNGICAKCGKHFELDEMEADHITPWSEGGTTTLDNLQLLCKHCNRVKSNK